MPWVFAMSCYASLLGHPWVSKCRFLSWQIAWIRPQPMREDDTHKTPSVIDWFITHMMWHITTVSRCYGCVCVTYKKLWNSDYSVTTPEVLAHEFVHVSYFEPIRRSAGILAGSFCHFRHACLGAEIYQFDWKFQQFIWYLVNLVINRTNTLS